MKSNKKSREDELPLHKKKMKIELTPEEAINEMRRKIREKAKKKNNGEKNAKSNLKQKSKEDPKERSQEKFKNKSKEKTKKKAKQREKLIKSEKKMPKNDIKVKVMSLGGLGEIGKNMTVLETENDIIVIDCGLGFPDNDMLGVDLVIPDTAYLESNADKIRGIFLTHGHEDHIGAIPYVLRKLNVPLFGTKLTLGIVENKLQEWGIKAELNIIKAGEKVRSGDFEVEFIAMNHSIADAVAFSIQTPCGKMIFTGDFKIDATPIDGEMADLARLGELGKKGVTALFCDSTNCERAGFTPSERTVGTSFDKIFENNKKRVIVATFSSNIHRVQQIIDASVKHERAVCILGRSMINIVGTAKTLGYMKIPEGALIEVDELKKFKPENVTLITTGCQGEAMSALTRMVFGSHDKVKIGAEDMVVISAHPIPGNEKMINNVINELTRKQVTVVYDQIAEVHVSGHACQEEIKMMFALTKPRFFVPVHGEYKHLSKNAELAEYAGIPKQNIFVSDIGKVIEFSNHGKKAEWGGTVPSGRIMVDGLGVGDVGSIVLRDRKTLSQEGIIFVAAAIDSYGKMLISTPEIESRGFIYVKENEDLIDEIRVYAENVIEKGLSSGIDTNSLKNKVKDEISKFLFNKTKRRPMIITTIIEA